MSRYVSWSAFLFSFHVAMAIVNLLGIFVAFGQPDTQYIHSVDINHLNDLNLTQSQVNTQTSLGFGDYIMSIFIVIAGFTLPIIVFPWTLQTFGVSPLLSFYITIPLLLMYALFIAQWWGNRNERSQG